MSLYLLIKKTVALKSFIRLILWNQVLSFKRGKKGFFFGCSAAFYSCQNVSVIESFFMKAIEAMRDVSAVGVVVG